MPFNVNEVIVRIKKAGAHNTRCVPMPGQDVHNGTYQVEIQEGGTWVPLIEGVHRSMGDDLIKQATNRLILG